MRDNIYQMSGLLFLSSDDFTVVRGQNGKILVHTIPGFALILFYSTQCEHCKSLIPIFKDLPGTLGGCQFGMINVSINRETISMSQDTISPIRYVPFILLYIDGKPYMKYQGPYDGREIGRFVFEVSQKLQNKAKFSPDVTVKEEARRIPEYTTGHPLIGMDDVTYLEFQEAYVEGGGR